jgi:BirA family transcriptional regulator, biotin operon repressor / biotin---[acetyl-CoA-carboxylase] ligase
VKRILLPSCESTNDYALALLRQERPEEGTLVHTPRQTRGRGQRGSVWEGEPGRNITASVILYPVFLDPRRQFDLSMAMSVAVADCVAAVTGLAPGIKWPNDVLLAGRKVAGLLIESRLGSGRIAASVVGIGLNVNQASFPPHLARAGSLFGVTGREHDIEEVLQLLHARVLERYGALRSGSAAIHSDYRSLLRGLGQEGAFVVGRRSFRGSIEGVDEEGRLLVRELGGRLRAYGPKEIAPEDSAAV